MTIKDVEARLAMLENKVKAQEKELTSLKDIEAIERLQKAYNYYVEYMLGKEIIDCFADSPDVVLDWIEGKFLGKEGVRRYFANAARGENPPEFRHQLMPIAGLITLEPDGRRAKGRWYAFGGCFIPNITRTFISGVYEMGYIKEGGIWKILSIKWVVPYAVQITDEMMPPRNPKATVREFAGPKPDVPMDRTNLRYVNGYILPFHFKHPVTGKETSEEVRNARLKPLKVD
jgi:hypothetical protein